MTTGKQVTENDFRLPEFRNANIADYEFDSTGKLVRKDRWKRAVETIRYYVGITDRTYEIYDVITAARKLSIDIDWTWVEEMDEGEIVLNYPDDNVYVDVLLIDRSIIRDVFYNRTTQMWVWDPVANYPLTGLNSINLGGEVQAWHKALTEREEG
jgi:hypothetical protein